MLAEADLVVFPSDFEGFGLPVVEGMLLGKPVVLGPEPATNEVAGGHAAVAADWTPAALADGVRRARAMTEGRARGGGGVGRDVHLGADDPADPRGAGRDEAHGEPAAAPAAAAVAGREATASVRPPVLLGVLFRRTSRLSGGRALPTWAPAVGGHRGAGPDARHRAPGWPRRGAGPDDAGGRAGRPCGVRAVAAPHGLGALCARSARRACSSATTPLPSRRARRPGYETSGYFGISGWREHPLFLRPRLPEPRPMSGTLLLSLATRRTTTNYYHFLTDLLPRWGVFEEAHAGHSS